MKASIVLCAKVIIKDYHTAGREQRKHGCLMVMWSADVPQEWSYIHESRTEQPEKEELITSEVELC